MLLLLSVNISLNSGPVYQDTMQCLREWNVLSSRIFHFMPLNINSLLSKIEELCYTAKSTNAAVMEICESKLDASALEQEISLDNYKILCCDRNRHSWGVACYVGNDLSYNILTDFLSEIEIFYPIFFEILLFNSKPITVGTIYRPPSQSNFLEVLNNNMNKIDSVDN